MVINLNAPVTSGSTGVINIMFVISNGGRHIREVVSQFTPPGFTQPQPTQTSADDWKVADEQQNATAAVASEAASRIGTRRHSPRGLPPPRAGSSAGRHASPSPPPHTHPPAHPLPRCRGMGWRRGRRSVFRHSSLAEVGEIGSALEQCADLRRSDVLGGLQAGDGRVTIVVAKPPSLGDRTSDGAVETLHGKN